jgi:hypothetical protein
MRSSDGEGRSIRSDALYPALSGEWEVPVTRNAKTTPVNEGEVGGGVGGPPLRDHLWQGPPVTRNAEIAGATLTTSNISIWHFAQDDGLTPLLR